jgi:hypothetical protein
MKHIKKFESFLGIKNPFKKEEEEKEDFFEIPTPSEIEQQHKEDFEKKRKEDLEKLPFITENDLKKEIERYKRGFNGWTKGQICFHEKRISPEFKEKLEEKGYTIRVIGDGVWLNW